jgi:hypothetical protein
MVAWSPCTNRFPTVAASNKPAFVTARVAVAVIVPTTWYESFVVVVVTCVDVPLVRVSTSVNKVVSVIAAVPAPVPIATYNGSVPEPFSRFVVIAFPAFVSTVAIYTALPVNLNHTRRNGFRCQYDTAPKSSRDPSALVTTASTTMRFTGT